VSRVALVAVNNLICARCEYSDYRIPILWTPQIALHSRALTECVQPPALCCRQTTAHPLEFGDDETGRATQHEVGKTDIPLNGRQPPTTLREGWSGVVYPPARPSRKVNHCSLEVPLALHGVIPIAWSEFTNRVYSCLPYTQEDYLCVDENS